MTTLPVDAAAVMPGEDAEARQTTVQSEETGNILADRFLQRYPTDEFFAPNSLRWLIIPEGYEGVRLRFGDRLSLLGADVGGKVKPGLRFMLGLGGLWSSMAVVNTAVRTNDLEMQQVVTEGGLQIPKADATLNWRVTDPVKAMTRASRVEDSEHSRIGYVHTTIETALARVRGYLSGRTIQELGEEDISHRNLAYLTKEETDHLGLTSDTQEFASVDELVEKGIDHEIDEYGHPQVLYRPTGLRRVGTQLDELYITCIDLPDTLEREIAERELALARAQGQREVARLAREIAEFQAEAAQVYRDNPGALDLLYADIAREYARSDGKMVIPIGQGIEGLRDLLRSRQPPTTS